MTVESATYVADLNSSLPTASDKRHEGDDHLRLLKSTILASFPNIDGAVSADAADLSVIDGLGGDGMVDQIAIFRTGYAPGAAPAFADTLLYVYGRNDNNDSSLMLVEMNAAGTGTGSAAIRGIADISTTASGAVAVRGESYLNDTATYVAGLQADVWADDAATATVIGVSSSFSVHGANKTVIGVLATNYTNYAGRTSSRITGSATAPVIAIGMRVEGNTGNFGGVADTYSWDRGFQVAADALDQVSGGICFEAAASADYGLACGGTYATAAVALNEDEKILFDDDNSQNCYITYNSASTRFEFYIGGVLKGYLTNGSPGVWTGA